MTSISTTQSLRPTCMPNAPLFAKALHALHQAGCLRDKACKPAIGMFVRQASESARYHLSAHYRSRAAEALLAEQDIASASGYQAWCCRHLRHEHMVPVGVVCEIIFRLPEPTEAEILHVLRRFSLRATITREQDRRLDEAGLKTRMPQGFWIPGSDCFMQPLARYMATGLDEELVARQDETWVPLEAAPGQRLRRLKDPRDALVAAPLPA